MIGKVQAVSLKNVVHPATFEMLMRYPFSDLRYYAKGLGLNGSWKRKEYLAKDLYRAGTTICGTVGN